MILKFYNVNYEKYLKKVRISISNCVVTLSLPRTGKGGDSTTKKQDPTLWMKIKIAEPPCGQTYGKPIDSRKFGYDVSVRTSVSSLQVGLSRHEFLPSSPRELCSLLFQKASEMIGESDSVYWAYVWCFLGGRGRQRFDTSVYDMHQQNGWRSFTMRWFSRPTFCISRLKVHNGYLSVTIFSSRYALPSSPSFVEIRKKYSIIFLHFSFIL